MKILITTSFIFIVTALFSQEVLWVNDSTGTTNQIVPKFSVNHNNNLFMVGDFRDNINIGMDNYLSFGNTDIFISKISNNGSYLASTQIGSASMDLVFGTANALNGNFYVVGAFMTDLNCSGTIINPTGSFDGFVTKYDENLNLIWAKDLVYGNDFQFCSSIDVDDNNNLVIAGAFIDSAILASTTTPDTLTCLKTRSLFISKFNINGDVISSIDFDATSNAIAINNIDSKNGYYYFAGKYSDTLFIYNDTIISSGVDDGFILCTDDNLNFQWLRKIHGTASDNCYTIDVDDNSNVLVGTYFASSDLVIDSTNTEISLITPTNKGNYDFLISSFSASTGELQWMKYAGSTGADVLFNSAYNNNILFLSGYYNNDIIYDTDTIANPYNSTDAIYLMINTLDGSLVNYQTINGPSNEKGYTVFNSSSGLNNEYTLTATFDSDTIFLANDTIVNSDVNANKIDMFVAKFGCPDNITISFNIDTITCPGGANGQIEAIPSDTVNYTWFYEWSGTETTQVITNLQENTYTVTITSSRNCLYEDSVYLTNYPALQTSLVDSITINCIAGNDGVAIVTPVDGVTPISYLWSDASSTTDSTVTGLAVGDYYVTVTDQCGDVIDTVSVGYMPTLSTSMSNHSLLVLCDTSTNGEATVTPIDGVAPYHYLWSTGANDTLAINSNLPVGQYFVTVTDVCNVPTIDSVQVNYLPTMNASITEFGDASCPNSVDGEAFIFATSGVPPYEYIWDNSDTLAQTNALDTGWHYVTVTDFCLSVVDSVFIDYNPLMTISINSAEDVSCPGSTDGEACVSVTNGVAPFFYNWEGSSSTNACVNDLSIGYQAVTVTDACGSQSDSVFIGTNPSLSTTVTQTVLATCIDDSNATAMVQTNYGATPFTYAWSNSSSTDTIATDLPVGYQYVTITDGCGIHVDSIMINSVTPLSVSNTASNILCYGDSTGSITLLPSNGVTPFTYTWSVSDSDSVATNLTAGTYYYTVTDYCGSVTGSVELLQPGAISVSSDITNESFSGTNDGEIDILVSGGNTPYSYYWSDYDNSITEDLEGLTEGIYIVTITDFNNCVLIDTFTVETEYNYIEIMNAFTPNGDGVNEEWTIKYIDQYPECQVDVYDQWGIQVFTSKGYTEKWNGKRDNTGSDMPAATYYYIIDLKDGSDQYTGSVTIIR